MTEWTEASFHHKIWNGWLGIHPRTTPNVWGNCPLDSSAGRRRTSTSQPHVCLDGIDMLSGSRGRCRDFIVAGHGPSGGTHAHEHLVQTWRECLQGHFVQDMLERPTSPSSTLLYQLQLHRMAGSEALLDPYIYAQSRTLREHGFPSCPLL